MCLGVHFLCCSLRTPMIEWGGNLAQDCGNKLTKLYRDGAYELLHKQVEYLAVGLVFSVSIYDFYNYKRARKRVAWLSISDQQVVRVEHE